MGSLGDKSSFDPNSQVNLTRSGPFRGQSSGERQLTSHDPHLCPQVSLCLLVCLSAFLFAVPGGRVEFFSTLGHPDTQDAERFFANMAQSDFAYRTSKGPWGTRRCGPDETSPERSRAANPKQSPIVYQDPYPNGGSRDIINGAYSNTPQR